MLPKWLSLSSRSPSVGGILLHLNQPPTEVKREVLTSSTKVHKLTRGFFTVFLNTDALGVEK